ncbi:hypothetical protein MRB53_040398 [Persea americana]|nr:hypothetical protein MRB53_040398 [Persea americana]
MLVTDPKQRATLAEIMTHPWMTKGFGGPPESLIPTREPLQLPLDPAVLAKMDGFEFGPADQIRRELEKIITSEEYQKACANAAKKGQTPGVDQEKKTNVFHFYQRRKSANSKDALTMPSNEAITLGEDPINAFSPLISIYYLVREKQERERNQTNPGGLTMPHSPGEKPLKLPDMPVLESAQEKDTTHEPTGEAIGREKARARVNGEDDREALVKAKVPATPTTETTPKKESGAIGLLRRFSTRRARDPERDRPAVPQIPPAVEVSEPAEAAVPSTPRKSFSVRKTREGPPSSYQQIADNNPQMLTPPLVGEGIGRKFKGLGRSTSVNSADMRQRWLRRGVSESVPSSHLAGSERASLISTQEPISEKAGEDYNSQGRERSTASRTRSVGHARRESMHVRRTTRDFPQEEDVQEETDQEVLGEPDVHTGEVKNDERGETIKPVFLKGLFSVSTTSSKPLSFLRADIIRVFIQLGIDFREVKGGFSCRHTPSIDLQKVVDAPATPSAGINHRRKISFAGLRSPPAERADDPLLPTSPRSTSRARRPQLEELTTASEEDSEDSHDHIARRSSRRMSSQARRRPHSERTYTSDASAAATPQIQPLLQQQTSTSQPQGANSRVAGETTTHVQSDLGQSMVLRFELLLVKVPFLSLHGLQFKKLDGGTWQYKRMAETILAELKL